MRRLNVRISDDDGARLSAEAERRGLTEADVVRLAIGQFLAEPAAPAAAPPKAATRSTSFGLRVEELGRIRRPPI